MRPAENIEKLIKNIDIDTNAKTDEAVFGDVIEAFEKSKNKKSASTQPNIWRIIMKSKITKLAAATVIIIVVATLIHYLDRSGNGVVWAEVVKNTERVQAFTYRERETQNYGGETHESETQCYVSTKYGFRTDNYKNGQIAISTFTLPSKKAFIGIVHPMKAYNRKNLPESEIARLQQMGPKYVVKLFMSVKYKELGRKIINGIEAKGIEVCDPSIGRANFPIQSFIGQLWVDVESGYPILLESKVVGDINGPIEINTIDDNFQWNIELDESVFEPNIPPDYNLMEK
jgi:outer membrane lipoprotein-sorting protein